MTVKHLRTYLTVLFIYNDMPNRVKEKGSRIEREIVNKARERGLLGIRAPSSDGRKLGLSGNVDLIVGDYKVQVKGKKAFPKWLLEASADVDIVVLKEDRKAPIVMLDYDKFLDLIIIEKKAQRLQALKDFE